jgi:predicted AAA+ superfamily ATPase
LGYRNEFLACKIEALDLSPAVCVEAKKYLEKYFYVGGMPNAVQTFVSENSLVSVRGLQNQILQTYIADFPLNNSRINVQRVEKIFHATVTQLGKKIIDQRLDTTSNSVSLLGESDSSVFKLYFLDTGLVDAIMRLDYEI